MNEQFVGTDISRQMFGKYQYVTKHGDHWYADQDFDGYGRPIEGAVAQDGFVYVSPKVELVWGAPKHIVVTPWVSRYERRGMRWWWVSSNGTMKLELGPFWTRRGCIKAAAPMNTQLV